MTEILPQQPHRILHHMMYPQGILCMGVVFLDLRCLLSVTSSANGSFQSNSLYWSVVRMHQILALGCRCAWVPLVPHSNQQIFCRQNMRYDFHKTYPLELSLSRRKDGFRWIDLLVIDSFCAPFGLTEVWSRQESPLYLHNTWEIWILYEFLRNHCWNRNYVYNPTIKFIVF